MKAVVMLDVDGVINIFPPPYLLEAADRWDDVAHLRANGYDIYFSPAVVQRIARWHSTGLAEVRWLTTWEDDANTHLADRFGFPQLSVAGRRDRRSLPTQTWWKLEFARIAYDEGLRVCWLDDDLQWDEPARRWVAGCDSHRMLAMAPENGLTLHELDRIELWLTEAAA